MRRQFAMRPLIQVVSGLLLAYTVSGCALVPVSTAPPRILLYGDCLSSKFCAFYPAMQREFPGTELGRATGTFGSADELQPIESVREATHEQDERSSLFVGLAPALFPSLQGTRIDA
jgi:hypothetical protein